MRALFAAIIANDFYSLLNILSPGEVEEKKIVSMEGQLQEHLDKMQRTKAEREKLECANGDITKNVSHLSLCRFLPLQYLSFFAYQHFYSPLSPPLSYDSTTSNTVNSHRRRKSSIVPRRNAKLTLMNVT